MVWIWSSVIIHSFITSHPFRSTSRRAEAFSFLGSEDCGFLFIFLRIITESSQPVDERTNDQSSHQAINPSVNPSVNPSAAALVSVSLRPARTANGSLPLTHSLPPSLIHSPKTQIYSPNACMHSFIQIHIHFDSPPPAKNRLSGSGSGVGNFSPLFLVLPPFITSVSYVIKCSGVIYWQ